MSLSETMKNHMDAVRGVTGASGLLSMAMATDALNDATGGLLPVHNIDFGGGKDMNDFTEQGQYLIKNAYSDWKSHNDPVAINGWGTLFVLKNDWYIIQIMVDNVDNLLGTYIRSKAYHDGHPWTVWRKLGGVVKSLLSALRRHFSSSLIGGVA